LLDTNVCIAWLTGAEPPLRERLLSIPYGDVYLCSIVKAELLYGARKSTRVDENLEQLDSFFHVLPSLPFDDAAAAHYGLVRAQLQRSGSMIGSNDLFIAATALGNDVTLVTRNENEFRRVVGLRVEVW
jgi:tRNA(fMet)-specific endonuclease VapC